MWALEAEVSRSREDRAAAPQAAAAASSATVIKSKLRPAAVAARLRPPALAAGAAHAPRAPPQAPRSSGRRGAHLRSGRSPTPRRPPTRVTESVLAIGAQPWHSCTQAVGISSAMCEAAAPAACRCTAGRYVGHAAVAFDSEAAGAVLALAVIRTSRPRAWRPRVLRRSSQRPTQRPRLTARAGDSVRAANWAHVN